MSDIELGSVISLIMENPELVAEIKRLAEKGASDTKEPESESTEMMVNSKTVPENTSNRVETSAPIPERKSNARGKRSELIHALSPYISEGRQKALETFMTIADILDMMREK